MGARVEFLVTGELDGEFFDRPLGEDQFGED